MRIFIAFVWFPHPRYYPASPLASLCSGLQNTWVFALGRAKYLGFPLTATFCAASSSWWRPCFVWKEDVSVVFSGFFKQGNKKEFGVFWRLLARFYGFGALRLFGVGQMPLLRCSQVADNRILL